jgi:ribosomal protein S19
MSRSTWKGVFFTNESFLFKKSKFKMNNRSNLVLPIHFNKLFNIYNGKQYIPIRFNKEGVIDHKVGEFAFSKKKCVKVKKEKKNFKLKK